MTLYANADSHEVIAEAALTGLVTVSYTENEYSGINGAVSISPVPEPATRVLLTLGSMALRPLTEIGTHTNRVEPNFWRPQGDSNPRYRRERGINGVFALFGPIR